MNLDLSPMHIDRSSRTTRILDLSVSVITKRQKAKGMDAIHIHTYMMLMYCTHSWDMCVSVVISLHSVLAF
jgi:hypothetical protein